jgi:FMN-dependent oxidoreductase (nitrilotriacetate monooxygenase family)
MTTAPFHLGWFMNFTAIEWDDHFSSTEDPFTGDFYVDMARSLERACFDYMLIEDTLMVPDAYGHSFDAYLKHAMMVPKHDPVPLATLMAAATKRIGLVATMSTSFYPPFMLARLAATVDHIARGRFGWNIVTSGEDSAAQNFGMDKLTEHDLRYDIADEYVDLCCKLWESWDTDAVVMDRDTGTWARGDRVRTIDFEGRWFKSRGPLNTVRPPQGRPVFVQAGGSPKGRQFAATWADSIVAIANGVEGMKSYRDDVRARAEAIGRKPDDIKVLFLVSPVLGETTAEAEERKARLSESDRYVEQSLLLVSSITDIDFSQFPLDEVLPPLTTNGEQGSLTKFMQEGSGKTLRQLAKEGLANSVHLVGTPDDVADQMGEIMAEVGGDGFLLTANSDMLSRRYIAEITDGLVPALQRRGLSRTSYTHEQFRDNLLEF